MTARQAWRKLKIAPTHDARAVRRAYAAALRAGDESDVDAMMALRNARDIALMHLLAEDAAPPAQAIAATDTLDAATAPITPEEIAGPAHDLDDEPTLADDPEGEPVVQAPPEHVAALHDLLMSQERTTLLDGAEIARATGWIAQVADDAAAGDIETHAAIGEWLADLLARSVPLSDPLIRPAAKAFNWEARAGGFDLSPALGFLVRRQRALNFVERVETPGHHHHRAWKELTKPADEGSRRGWFVGKRRVAELVSEVRRDHPMLEDERFDAWRISMWDGAIATGGIGTNFPWWMVGLLLFALVRICSEVLPDKDRNSTAAADLFASTRLVGVDRDSTDLLKSVSPDAPDFRTLTQDNPELAAWIGQSWKQAADAKTPRVEWFGTGRKDIMVAIDAARHYAPYDLVAQRRRYELAILDAFGIDGGTRCDFDRLNTWDGKLSDAAADQIATMRNAYFAAAIRQVDPTRRVDRDARTFSVPGSIVEKARASANMTPERFGAALKSDAETEDRCRAWTALGAAALAAPKTIGLPILRAM